MVDEPEYTAHSPHAALMVRSRRLHIVWIIPVVAVIAAGWLGWRSYAQSGPTITILFENAAGIEAGRTQIKYKNIVFGTVEKVEPTKDLSQVVVTARMGKAAEPYLAESTYFWVVKPSLSGRDFSGLGTLITGAYIGFEPGKGNAVHDFVGEQSPLFMPVEEAGQIFTLHTNQLGSINQGAAVYFHGIKVGRVLGYTISKTDGSIEIRIFIDEAHAALVHTGSRFWNTSGMSVTAGSNGLKVQLNSIESLLTGGIAFDVPPATEPGPSADANSSFTLYVDETTADDSIYTQRPHFLLHFTQAVPGLAVGSPVRLQGVPIGQVSDMRLQYDNAGNPLLTPVTLEIEAQRFLPHNGAATPENVFRKLVAKGLRARLGSGNLLTGQKVIDLEIMPNAPPARMIEGGAYPEIPITDADDLDAIVHSTKQLLSKLQTASEDLDKTLKQANTAISSDEGGGDLAGTLAEVKNTARSVRVLSDYLETHPEALLEGKTEEKP